MARFTLRELHIKSVEERNSPFHMYLNRILLGEITVFKNKSSQQLQSLFEDLYLHNSQLKGSNAFRHTALITIYCFTTARGEIVLQGKKR